MSIITISSIFNNDYNDYIDFCNNTVVADFIDTTTFETTLTTYVYSPIWLRYKDTPIKFSNDEKGQDAFLRNFYNQLSEVVFDFHNYAKENIEYFLYQNDVTKQGKPMSKTITSGINPINQTIDQEVDSTNIASGTGSQFISETVYNGIAWHKLVEGYFTPNRKTEMLKTFQWLFISVYSPETKYDDKIEQVRYVELSFVDDDNNIIDEQKVYPTKSYFTMSEVDIARPENLEPQNIAKDVDIAGVVGTLEPNVTEVTENSDLTQNQVITTPSGYDGMSKVTIVPPATAIPSNIKKDVNIGGVVGTYEPNILNYLDYQLDLTGDMDIDASDYNADGIKEVFIGIPPTARAENIKQGVNIGGIVGTLSVVDTLSHRITTGSDPYEYENNDITGLRNYAFYKDTNITSFKSTSITTLSNGNAFQNCTNLETVYLPNVTNNAYSNNFNGCTNLKYVTLTLSPSCSDYSFQSCSNLENISLPSLRYGVGQYAFASCSKLKTVDLGDTPSIGNMCFRYDSQLTDIYLHKSDTIVTIASNSFSNITVSNPIKIHVPSSLIATYQTATNWSTLYSAGTVTFVAL